MTLFDVSYSNISDKTNTPADTVISEFDEQLLDDIVKSDKSMFSKAIKKANDPKFTMALSDLRANFIEWIPVKKTDRILEIGSGYGELSGVFAQKAKNVCCFDFSLIKSIINTKRNSSYNNIEYFTNNDFAGFLQDISNRKFDYICLADAFAKAHIFLPNSDAPYCELLQILTKHLSENGKFIIAVDNKYALKFFNGSRVEGEKNYFTSFRNLVSDDCPRTFSKEELISVIESSGLLHFKFFYPFPEYKIAFSIYTDQYQPKIGEITEPEYTWEDGKINMYKENEVFGSIASDGKFPFFSNSYLVIASPLSFDNQDNYISDINYIKYSNDRRDLLKIRTEVINLKSTGLVIRKIPLSRYSRRHINNITKNYKKLTDIYADDKHSFNKCELCSSGIELEYLEGGLLSEAVSQLIVNGDFDGIRLEFNKLYNFLNKRTVNFVPSRKFKEVFGNVFIPPELKACPISNIDMILANILVDKKGKYNVIDYEWTFDFTVPVTYILFRSLFYQFKKQTDPEIISLADELYESYGITKELKETFIKMEQNFQIYVAADHTPIRELKRHNYYDLYKNPIQIFEDLGNGFGNDISYFHNAVLQPNGMVNFKVKILPETKRLRVDPCSEKCVVKIIKITDPNGISVTYSTNGTKLSDDCYLFRTNDPQIIIKTSPDNPIYEFSFSMEINILSENISKSI